MKTEDIVIAILCVALLIVLAVCVSALPTSGPTEGNYSRIANGMDIVQVTEIIGEGEIHFADNRMVVMKYVGEGVEIRVIFVNGIVYQKSLELDGIATNQDGGITLEIEL